MPTKRVSPKKEITEPLPITPRKTISTNQFLIGLLIIAAFALGMMYNKIQYLEKTNGELKTANVNQPTTKAVPTPVPLTQDKVKALFTEKNIYFGNKNSKNLIFEIADPSCPYCHIAAGKNPELNKQAQKQFWLTTQGGTYVAPEVEIKKLVDQGKAAFVWIYYPGHGNGEMGTKALYCAHEKGEFWPVHDLLMSNAGYNLLNNEIRNDVTKSQQLVDFLASATNATELKQCLDSGKYDAKLQEDTTISSDLFKSFPQYGTPGFAINTTIFGGAYSWTDMKTVVK